MIDAVAPKTIPVAMKTFQLYDKKIITTVANDLFISQPALTKRLKKIENEFGVILFNRTKKGVEFTQYGKLVYDYCKKNINNKEELLKKLNNIKDENKALQLGCATSFTLYALPEILNQFFYKHKDIEVIINSSTSYNIYQKLLNKEMNVAIIREDYEWEGKKIKLFDEPVCLIYNEEISLSELNNIPAITYKSSPTLENKMKKWIKENNISLASGTYKTNDITSAYNLVNKGVGWSIMSSIALKNFTGYVKPLNISGEKYARTTYLYYSNDYKKCEKLSKFINFITENYIK